MHCSLSLTGAKQTMNEGERTGANLQFWVVGHSQVRKIMNLAVFVNLFG